MLSFVENCPEIPGMTYGSLWMTGDVSNPDFSSGTSTIHRSTAVERPDETQPGALRKHRRQDPQAIVWTGDTRYRYRASQYFNTTIPISAKRRMHQQRGSPELQRRH